MYFIRTRPGSTEQEGSIMQQAIAAALMVMGVALAIWAFCLPKNGAETLRQVYNHEGDQAIKLRKDIKERQDNYRGMLTWAAMLIMAAIAVGSQE